MDHGDQRQVDEILEVTGNIICVYVNRIATWLKTRTRWIWIL